jgi:hypothetical protein
MTRSNPKLHKAARALERQGRAGDTLLAHISPWEAALLRALGGAGTRNPATGLLEFKYGADTKEGGARGGGASVGNRGGGAGSANAAIGLMGDRTTTTRNAAYGQGFGAGRFGNENAAAGVLAKAQPGYNASPIARAAAILAGAINPTAGLAIGALNALGAFDDIGGVSVTQARDGMYGGYGAGSGLGGMGGGPGNALDRLYRSQLVAQELSNRPPAGGLLTPSTVPARAPWPQPTASSGALAPYSAMTRFGPGQLGALPWGYRR